MSLTREDILSAGKTFATDVVPVPEWGGDIRLRAISYAERGALAATLEKAGDGEKSAALTAMNIRLVRLSMVDDDDKRMFTEADEKVLAGLNPVGFQKVLEAARALNNMGPRPSDDEDAGPLAD